MRSSDYPLVVVDGTSAEAKLAWDERWDDNVNNVGELAIAGDGSSNDNLPGVRAAEEGESKKEKYLEHKPHILHYVRLGE